MGEEAGQLRPPSEGRFSQTALSLTPHASAREGSSGLRDQEVGGSNPLAPTTLIFNNLEAVSRDPSGPPFLAGGKPGGMEYAPLSLLNGPTEFFAADPLAPPFCRRRRGG